MNDRPASARGPAFIYLDRRIMREKMDERLDRLTAPDPREGNLPKWAQWMLNAMRREITDGFEREKTLRMARPLEGSDAWLEVGTDDERWVGLGHRARILIPLGDERWDDGRPKRYVEVQAGRPQRIRRLNGSPEPRNPVTHVEIRTSGRAAVHPDCSNVVHVETTDRH